MNQKVSFPSYLKITLILVSLCLIGFILYVGQQIIFPLLLALFIAILLRPVVVFFDKKLHLPHLLSVLFAVILCLAIFASIILFLSWEIGDIANDWIKIKTNLNYHFHSLQKWVLNRFHISYKEQDKYLAEATRKQFENGNDIVSSTIVSLKDGLLNLVVVPVYTFLFLLYRNLFINFLVHLFKEENKSRLFDILMNVKSAIRSYLLGIITEMGIVASLTGLGLMIAGVEYAVLLGVITGILNLIPYIGITIAALLSIIATLTTSTNLSIILGVIIVNVVVQFLDNNILVPLIVSSKVKINALVSIVGIIIGGALAGVSGMFLAIPIIAVLKVIFDRIDGLKPWGILLGDNLTKTFEWGKIKFPSMAVGLDNPEPDKKPEPVKPPQEPESKGNFRPD